MNASGIKIKSSVDKSSFVSQFTRPDMPKIDYNSFVTEFTSMKTPEIYSSADQNIKVETSRSLSSLFKKKNRKKET